MQANVDRLTALLREKNGQDARTLASMLRLRYQTDVHKREVNPLLYARVDLFERRGTSPPIWYLKNTAEQPPNVARSPQTEHGTKPTRYVPQTARHTPVSAPQASNSGTGSLSTVAPSKKEIKGDEDETWSRLKLDPYTWQKEAFNWWLKNQCMGIIEAVTGTGKTTVGLAAIALAQSKKLRTLLIVPSIVLQDQWSDKLGRFLPSAKVARIGGGNSGAGLQAEHDVLIAVVNSAATWASQLNGRYGLVVADECHRYGATSFRQALLPASAMRIGLTATLERMDDGVDEALKPFFSNATFTYDFDKATSDQVLASFVVANLGIALTASEREEYEQADELCRKARAALINSYGYPADVSDFMTKVTAAAKTMMRLWGEGKYASQYVSNFSRRIKVLADTPNRLDALLSLKSSIGLASRTLVFTETVEAANHAATALKRIGVTAEPYHSALDTKTREYFLQKFRDGSLKALVAVKALDEGVDVPDVNLGIIMSASHQKRQMIQRLGRIVRKKPDASYAVLVNMFATDTNEDPRRGNHEGFLNAIENGADEIELFPNGCTAPVFEFIDEYLTSRGATKETPEEEKKPPPTTPIPPPVSQPPRSPIPEKKTDVGAENSKKVISSQTNDSAELVSLRRLVDAQNGQIAALEESQREQQDRIDELETDLSAIENLSSRYRDRVDELTGIVNKLQVLLAQMMVKNDPPKKPQATKLPSETNSSNYIPGSKEIDEFRICRQCGGDGGAGGRCPRCSGNGFEPRD